MHLLRRGVALLVFAVVSARPSWAQEAPLVLELRGGIAAPVASFSAGVRAGEGGSAGPTFSLDFILTGEGRRALDFGFSQHRFGCGGTECAPGGRYVATGFDVGYRLRVIDAGPVLPWVRLGALTTRVEAYDLAAPNGGVTKLGIGGAFGAGVYLAVSDLVALNPGVRFAAVNTRLPGGTLLRMRYLVAGLALAIPF